LVAARKARRVLGEANMRQGSTTLHELIHDVCEAFDYDLTLHSAGPSGLRAWANVLKLIRYAEQFEMVESGDLASFAAYLRNRSEGSKDKAAPAEAGEDVVRIMTVHAAKGLEFPVVFAADLGALQRHGARSVIVTKQATEAGPIPVVGVRLPSDGDDLVAATSVYQRLCAERERREVDEQKRCLYVACTRAEELLVISGCSKLSGPAAEGAAMIDWIREALGDPTGSSQVPVGATTVSVSMLSVSEEAPPLSADAPEIDAPLAVDERRRERTLEEPCRPQRVSYSSMHTHAQCPLSYQVKSATPLGEFRPPSLQTASDFGSALHWVMQRADRLDSAEVCVPVAARRYDLDVDGVLRLVAALAAYFGSELATRVAHSGHVAREEPIRVSFGETALVGNVDVLALTGERALIVDYKTGKNPDGASGDRCDGYELQAKCYALAAFEAGAREVEAVFCFVEHGPRELVFTFSADDSAKIRDEIGARIERMASDTSTHLGVYQPEICDSCPALGGVCPIDSPPRRR